MLSTKIFASFVLAWSSVQAMPSALLERDQHPTQFEPFDPSCFCQPRETTITLAPNAVLYPVKPKAIFDIVGDFFNISWIGVQISHSTGRDDYPGATRYLVGDPFAQEEVLTYYALDPRTYAHQQVAKTGAPVIIYNSTTAGTPNYVEQKSHSTIEIDPQCNGNAAKFGFTVTFCMTGPAPPGLDLAADLFAGSSAALKNLWTNLLGLTAPFNSTTSCNGLG